jgi:integrase
MKIRLTQTSVAALKSAGKGYWVTDGGCQNLRIFVGASGSKTWYASYRDEKGNKQSVKLGSAQVLTVAQAREKAKDTSARVLRGENVKKEKRSEKLTLGGFINNIFSPERKPSKHMLWRLNKQFKDRFYSSPIGELTVKDLLIWRNERIECGVKAATVNKDIGALKAALTWGVYQGCIDINPLEKLRRLPEVGISDEADSKEIIRYLSSDERERLHAALDAREQRIRTGRDNHNELLAERGDALLPPLTATFVDHIKPMVIISLNSGLRRGSLFGLLWADIDFDNEVLILRPSNVKSKKKTILPMSAVTMETLLAWREQTSNEGLVFPSPVTGTMLTNVKKAWAGVLKDAHIENFRWHDMRHDFASRLVMSGVDLFRVQKLMGHSDISMTLRYAHLAPSDLQKTISLLDSEPVKKVQGKIMGQLFSA